MKQSDTYAIANLYVESINMGGHSSGVDDRNYNKICDIVADHKGEPLEDVIYTIEQKLNLPQITGELKTTIETVWNRVNNNTVAARIRGKHPGQTPEKDANPRGGTRVNLDTERYQKIRGDSSVYPRYPDRV